MYEGEYKQGKKEGRGTYRYANGDVEVGSYKAGKDVEYYERIVEKEARDAFRSEGGAAAAMYGGSNLLAGMGTGDDEPYDDADASLYAPKTAGASGDAVRRPAAGRRVIDDDADD